MPELPLPVRVLVRQEAPPQGRQHQRHPRRGQADPAGGAHQHEQRGDLDLRGEQPIEQGAAARGGRHAVGGVAAQPVLPGARRAQQRHDDEHRQDEGQRAEQRHVRARPHRRRQICPHPHGPAGTPSRRPAVAVVGQARARVLPAAQRHGAARHDEGQPHVLLDQHQRRQPQRARRPAALDEGDRGPRQGRHGEGDLVELCLGRALDAPGQDVEQAQRGRDQPGRQARGQARQRPGRHRQEQVLDHQQGQRRGEQAPDGAEQDKDRVEVVAQEVVALALDRHDRGPAVGVVLGELGEDRQVPARHRDGPPLVHGVGDEDPCAHGDGEGGRQAVQGGRQTVGSGVVGGLSEGTRSDHRL